MQNDIPPKQTVSGTPILPPGTAEAGYDRLPPGAPPGALVSVRDLPGDAGAFPVLKAFQDYLEMERQQARKRLVTLTAFFVCLMALVVGGFIIAFVFLFRSMNATQTRLLDVALQEKKMTAAPAAGTSAAELAAARIESAAMNLQTNLGGQIASVGATAAQLDTRVAAQNEAVTGMRELLARMEAENARLQSQVTNMQATLPKLALEAARKVAPPPVPAGVAAPAREGTPPVAFDGPGAVAPPGYDAATLSLRGRDGAPTTPWRVLLPSAPGTP